MKNLKMDYAGHVARGGEDWWEKRVMEWVPRKGRRKVGRPRTRLEGEIIQVEGVAWGRDAAYRSRWKRVREAYAQGWALVMLKSENFSYR